MPSLDPSNTPGAIAPLTASQGHALATIERVLAEALGRDVRDLPVFTPRNVTALAYEVAARLRGGA